MAAAAGENTHRERKDPTTELDRGRNTNKQTSADGPARVTLTKHSSPCAHPLGQRLFFLLCCVPHQPIQQCHLRPPCRRTSHLFVTRDRLCGGSPMTRSLSPSLRMVVENFSSRRTGGPSAGRHPSSMRIFASAADSAVAVVLSTARWTSLKWTARSKPLPVGLGTSSGSSSALAATTATAAAATTKSADRNMMAERGMRGRVEIAEKGEGGARSVRSKVEMRASGGERTSCGGIAAVHGPTLAVDRV